MLHPTIQGLFIRACTQKIVSFSNSCLDW
jgi:hypothetical protein